MGSASSVLTLTVVAVLLPFTASAAQERAALVFTRVDSESEPAAKELLKESLLHAIATRMAIVPCKESTRDEIEWLKLPAGELPRQRRGRRNGPGRACFNGQSMKFPKPARVEDAKAATKAARARSLLACGESVR